MTTDLETAVRSMLHERATDIGTLPADFEELASLDVLDLDARSRFDGRSHRGTWLIAAAVAAVLAVVGTAVAVGGRAGHKRVAPASHSPSVTRTASPAPSVLRRTTCTLALPAVWSSALAAGTSKYGAASAMPLAISPDGSTMLIARDFGQARDVALVKDGGAPRSIYSVPQPGQNQVENASLDDRYAAIDLDHLPRNANGVIPEARKVLLVTLSSGSVKELDQAPYTFTGGVQGRTIDGSLLWNGHVYWDVRKTYTDQVTTVTDYDIATGRTTVAGQGGGWIPRLLADGVTFDPQGSSAIAVPRQLPAQVAAATEGRRNFLVTDGDAYAWTTSAKQLAWWVAGQQKITLVTPPAGFEPSALQTVAGNFLIFDNQVGDHSRTFVTDARTGATAMLPAQLQSFQYSANGVALGYRFAGAVKESATEGVRLDTGKLPELRC